MMLLGSAKFFLVQMFGDAIHTGKMNAFHATLCAGFTCTRRTNRGGALIASPRLDRLPSVKKAHTTGASGRAVPRRVAIRGTIGGGRIARHRQAMLTTSGTQGIEQ